MISNKERIYEFIKLHMAKGKERGVTTKYIAGALNMQRTNVSSILSTLVDEGKIGKSNGRPVLYFIYDNLEGDSDNCFVNMIGYNGSLRRAVQLAKAAVLYPQKSLNSVIIGAKGTGKSLLAMLMHKFAIQSGVLSENSKFIVFNCKSYSDNEKLASSELFGDDSSKGCFTEAEGGVLLIDNVQYLSSKLRRLVISQIEIARAEELEDKKVRIVILSCDNKNSMACDDFTPNFPIIIELPTLGERPIMERMELIQSFLTLEAARIKRTLNINAELLRSLLLYECELNCMQLKADIKIGCANAYVREHKGNGKVQLFISDFEHHVRRGFLKYKTYREEIEQLIPYNYNYSFSETSMKMSEMDKEKLKSNNIYHEIDRKSLALAARGLEEDEINLLLSTELESIFNRYQNELTKEVVNKEQIAILVDKQIINIVEDFLDEASIKLGRNFSNSVFYGLCLHLNSLINKQPKPNRMALKQISDILENYKTEYMLSMELSLKLKQVFEIELPIEEVILITMFISYETPISNTLRKPVILFAFYGVDVAISIVKTITALTQLENVFSFELNYEKDSEEIYASLKQYISKIERGKGVIVVYDSSFLKEMLISIEEELKIIIRQLPIPITTIGIELARKAAVDENVDRVYQRAQENLNVLGVKLRKIIVTLCTTGKGGAEELKHYIESYGKVEDMEVIPLSISDEDALREELADMMRTGIIQCVVGTFDPKFYSLPFISISEVFGTPKEKLPSLLRRNKEAKKLINYDDMLSYLDEQLLHTNMEKLKKLLPALITDINERVCELTVDTEVGLFIHISCCIERILSHSPLSLNIRKEMIISKYYKQYRILLKLLKPMEKSFDIIFSDDEIANILTIIYKL